MPNKTKTIQLELFPQAGPSSTLQTPQWQSLPNHLQQSLTQLMVRLIADHAGKKDGGSDHEA